MSKKVTLFNTSERAFQFPEGVLNPKSTLDVEVDRAEKILSAYGKEIIKGGLTAPGDNESKREKSLLKKIDKLQARIDGLEAELAEAKQAQGGAKAELADKKEQ